LFEYVVRKGAVSSPQTWFHELVARNDSSAAEKTIVFPSGANFLLFRIDGGGPAEPSRGHEMLTELGVPDDEFWRNYVLLQVFDRLSLGLCKGDPAGTGSMQIVLPGDAELAVKGTLSQSITIETTEILMLPDMASSVTPLVYAIPVQLIAYHTAAAIGTDVDQPRNLAKSVTVE